MIFLLVTFLNIMLIMKGRFALSVCVKRSMLAFFFSILPFSHIGRMAVTIPSLIMSMNLSLVIRCLNLRYMLHIIPFLIRTVTFSLYGRIGFLYGAITIPLPLKALQDAIIVVIIVRRFGRREPLLLGAVKSIHIVLKALTFLTILVIRDKGPIQMSLIGRKTTIDLLCRWKIDNMVAIVEIKKSVGEFGFSCNLFYNFLKRLPGGGDICVIGVVGLLTNRTILSEF